MFISITLEFFFYFSVLCSQSGTDFYFSFWWNYILETFFYFYSVSLALRNTIMCNLYSTQYTPVSFLPLILSSSHSRSHPLRPVVHPVPLPSQQLAAVTVQSPGTRFASALEAQTAAEQGHGKLILWWICLQSAFLFSTPRDAFLWFAYLLASTFYQKES